MHNKRSWFITLSLTLVASLVFSVGQARELDEDEVNHVPVGTELLAQDEAEALMQERFQEIGPDSQEGAEEDISEDVEAELGTLLPGKGEDKASLSDVGPQTKKSIHPTAKGIHPAASFFHVDTAPRGVHHVLYYATNPHTGQVTLETEDGALWTVSSNSSAVYNWLPSDEIAIYPSPWYISSPYQLYNLQTNSSVYVDLKLGPFYDSDLTRWVVAISWDSGELWLNDGSRWLVKDLSVFNSWDLNHTIILGSNNDWFTSYPSVLINVNTYDSLYPKLSYVRAVCLTGPAY